MRRDTGNDERKSMPESKLTGLRSVELGVPDVAADAKFYTEIWGLAMVAEHRGAVYLRGTGAYQYILALHPRPKTELLGITLAARSRADVDALHAAVTATGVRSATLPAPVSEPGGGYAFAFKDPEGRIFRIIADDARHSDAARVPDRPERLAHVVLNSADASAATKFAVDALGFKISDRTRMMDFLRCNRDHHNVAFARSGESTLHHVAYLVSDLDSVMRGTGLMKDNGYPIEWGVGRHGPGNNVFAYFIAPDGAVIEYTSEVEEVDDNYKAGGPGDWGFQPGRTDQWGITAPPSARIKLAQEIIKFAGNIAYSR
ncbi:MAG: VOC family protein [Burkholderiales bacterium]